MFLQNPKNRVVLVEAHGGDFFISFVLIPHVVRRKKLIPSFLLKFINLVNVFIAIKNVKIRVSDDAGAENWSRLLVKTGIIRIEWYVLLR